jgi:2-polyprenyl-3-methyl-5-hydroxy-6-metoxy-1,4-benzoquinol methylase
MIAFWPYFILHLDKDVQQWYPRDVLLPTYLDAAIEISTFMKTDLTEVINKLREELVVREAWREIQPDPTHDQAVMHFYDQTDGYIFDGMHNYAGKNSEEGLLWLLDRVCIAVEGQADARILDYGAGTGTKTLFLKQLGYNVTHADIASQTLYFAEWRYQQRFLNIPCVNLSQEQLLSNSFDCIVCISVVEHVVDIPSLIQKLATLLKPQGYLICNGHQSCADSSHIAHLPQNFQYGGKAFVELLSTLGFKSLHLESLYRKES